MANYFSAEELAKRWGVNYRTILNMLSRGDIPHFKVGTHKRILKADVYKYEKQNNTWVEVKEVA